MFISYDTTLNYVTNTEKNHIKLMLDKNIMAGKIGRKEYHITKKENYLNVTICENGRGVIPCAGSKIRKMYRNVELLIK